MSIKKKKAAAMTIKGLFKNSTQTDPHILYEIRKAIARLYRSGSPAYIDMVNEVRNLYPYMKFSEIAKAIGEMRSETAAARKAYKESAKVKRVVETAKPKAVAKTLSNADDDMLFPPEVMRATLNKPSYDDLDPTPAWAVRQAKKMRKKSTVSADELKKIAARVREKLADVFR